MIARVTPEHIREAKALIDERTDGTGYQPWTEEWLSAVAGDLFDPAVDLPVVIAHLTPDPILRAPRSYGVLVGMLAMRLAETAE